MRSTKVLIRNILKNAGYEVKYFDSRRQGIDAYQDMQFLSKGVERPVIFDVGANVGQSVDKFKEWFPDATIHSFEPSPSTFLRLKEHCHAMSSVKVWNYGIGSTRETLPFLENSSNDMSSFLAPSKFCWGKIEKTTHVDVLPLDWFAAENDIKFIHILKSDTQGFDLEVFKGAESLMNENKIALIYFEFVFSDMYKNLPPFHEVFRFLTERNFALVAFYPAAYQEDLVSWADLLFINIAYNRQRLAKPAEHR
jgi:FkbM family methyltransferase